LRALCRGRTGQGEKETECTRRGPTGHDWSFHQWAKKIEMRNLTTIETRWWILGGGIAAISRWNRHCKSAPALLAVASGHRHVLAATAPSREGKNGVRFAPAFLAVASERPPRPRRRDPLTRERAAGGFESGKWPRGGRRWWGRGRERRAVRTRKALHYFVPLFNGKVQR
jgi:hypothetical protein